MEKKKRQLILKKGGEKFIFRYEDGREDELLDALIEQAKSKGTNFDWFDAAVLAFRLTETLMSRADELLQGNLIIPKGGAECILGAFNGVGLRGTYYRPLKNKKER